MAENYSRRNYMTNHRQKIDLPQKLCYDKSQAFDGKVWLYRSKLVPVTEKERGYRYAQIIVYCGET